MRFRTEVKFMLKSDAKKGEYNFETGLAFIDIKKAFDNVKRFPTILEHTGYPRHLITAK